MVFLLVACAGALRAQPSLLRESVYPGSVMGKYYRMGLESLRQGEYETAVQRFRECLQMPLDRGLNARGAVTECSRGVSWVFELRGQLDEAMSLHDRAALAGFQLRSEGALDRARLMQASGRAQDALQVVEETLKSYTEKEKKEFPAVRQLLNLRAELQWDTGQFGASRATIEAARAVLWKEKEPVERLVRGRLERVASVVLLAAGKLEDAEAAARRAVELHLRDQAEETWDVQMDRLALADVLRREKRAQEAAEIYQQAFKTLTARLGPAQPQARYALAQLAVLLNENGQPVDARRVREALARLPRSECKVCAVK